MSHARAVGVTVALEPLSRQACNWINTAREAVDWIEQFDPSPAILFDLHHAWLEEPSVHAALIVAWPHLSYVRMSDSNLLAPGLGHYPFPETIRILGALGYELALDAAARL